MEEGRAREEYNEDGSRHDGRDIPVEIIVVHTGSLYKGAKESVSRPSEISFREEPRGFIDIFSYQILHRLPVATATLTALIVPRMGDSNRFLTPESTRSRLWAERLYAIRISGLYKVVQ
jgi:hypothetical protein